MIPERIFIGYDSRQPLAYTVLHHSIIRHASIPVSITPLVLGQLPITRRGLTEFTYSRFLVPYLCGFEGRALFMDIDVAVRADIKGLFDLAASKFAVMVTPRPPQLRYELTSVCLFNCGHPALKALTPEAIERASKPHTLTWLPDDAVGYLPDEWNHLVGYDPPDTLAAAKLLHYTKGIPAHPEVRGEGGVEQWEDECRAAVSTRDWATLMGPSVHAASVLAGPS